MKHRQVAEYGLLVTSECATQTEAEHALRDPFIEDWVERTGRFRIHQLSALNIVPGVTLAQLQIEPADEGEFIISSADPGRPLTAHKARALAEALRRQAMFDEIEVAPLDQL